MKKMLVLLAIAAVTVLVGKNLVPNGDFKDPNNIKLGIIGMTEGNGHPYSWSAIFNRYDVDAMTKECPFPGIMRTQTTLIMNILKNELSPEI